MQEKLKDLEQALGKLSSIAVAFSGGADSSFLLAVAKKIHPENLIAITISSQFVPKRDVEAAKKNAEKTGVKLICLDVDILENNDVVKNTLERCYHCKKHMFSLIKKTAETLDICSLLHGVNLDDLNDFRPGLQAARELGFLSPLADAGFFKADIRRMSRKLGLDTWNKPSQSCLATRIPYNERILSDSLKRVDTAEAFLQTLGFEQVRVRCHKTHAMIEVAPHLVKTLLNREIWQKVETEFLKIGFDQTRIDNEGYKTEKTNHEILPGTAGSGFCHPA